MVSHDSLVWSARRGGGGVTYVRDHPTLQVMGYSRDVGKPNNHEACSLGGAWVGYPIEKFQRKFRRGFTPYAALERFGVAQTEAAPVWGGGPPYAGVRGSAPQQRGGSDPGWSGAVLGGRAAPSGSAFNFRVR